MGFHLTVITELILLEVTNNKLDLINTISYKWCNIETWWYKSLIRDLSNGTMKSLAAQYSVTFKVPY